MFAVPPHHGQTAADERMTGICDDDIPQTVRLIAYPPCISLVSLRPG
jgi:hypothetical protein